MSPPKRDAAPALLAPRTTSVNGLLDAGQVAELLNVPASWVYAEARAGRMPHVELGRYRRFEPHVVEAWWRARRRGPIPIDADQQRASRARGAA